MIHSFGPQSLAADCEPVGRQNTMAVGTCGSLWEAVAEVSCLMVSKRREQELVVG